MSATGYGGAQPQSMGRLRRSWELTKVSWGVLKQDRELIWLTVIGFAACVVIASLGALVIWLSGSGAGVDNEWELNGAVAVIAAIATLLLCAFVGNYVHGAIVHGATDRLSGGDPTIKSALAGARARLGLIIQWTLLAVLVGWLIAILRGIADRYRLGWLVGAILDTAWAVLTFLVMPIIIVERAGPFTSLKRSKDLLKQTWGENLLGQFGLGLIGFLAALPAIVLIGVSLWTGLVALIVIAFVVGVLWILSVSLVMSALKSVYQSAMYRFAVTGEVAQGFGNINFKEAFKTKPKPLGGRSFLR